MEKLLEVKSDIKINSEPKDVWQTITDPLKIPQFMMGMQAVSTWKTGDELRWIGRHGEKPDDNARGTIVKMEAPLVFKFTFYYPGYGYPDEPRYYNIVCYRLQQVGNQTEVTVSQGDFSVFDKGETFVNHSQDFWDQVLQNLKVMLEK